MSDSNKRPTTETLCALIAQNASINPQAVAIEAPGRVPLDYSHLYQVINNTALELKRQGIGRNDRVAIVLPNGPEMAVCFLAVAACATCAPLNPQYKREEFEFYLNDLNAKAVVLHKDLDSPVREVATALGIPVIELTAHQEGAAGLFLLGAGGGSITGKAEFAEPDDIALVLHTSGTTARPKIVPLSHRNICASAQHVSESLQLSNQDRCLNVMPLFHIHGLIAALVSSMAAGASVICSGGYDDDHFFDWIDKLRPTWYTAVPTIHQAILTRAADSRDIIERVPLRFIRSSSAALPPNVMSELESTFNTPVIEAYGMTESAHQIASNPLPPESRKVRSVGRAAGPEVAIMDESGELVSQGDIGEIVIRGPNVTQGYEQNIQANETSFVHGWFRTGDQGMIDQDDYLYITGRLKEIINRGGEKVSPREIDEVLLEHSEISQAVTFAIPHPTLGEDVVAAVVLRNQSRLREPDIRELAFSRLAGFKVPSQILIVDEIPKGATGKIQRIGLAEKFRDQLAQDFIAPQDEFELIIAEIICEVLGVERLGIKDNFFAIGGDSLTATQVVSRLRSTFHVDLPIVTMFKRPTVAELAAEISTSGELADAGLIAEVLDELENLTEEEARQLLEKERGQ